jgi:hypothetical protein
MGKGLWLALIAALILSALPVDAQVPISERQPFGRCCLDHPSLLLPRLMGAATVEVAAVAMVAAATAQAATEQVIALMAEMRPRLLPLPPGVWPFFGAQALGLVPFPLS